MIRKGTLVRRPGRKMTALVVGTNLIFGSKPVRGSLFLDRPLEGFRYWHRTDLRRAKKHLAKNRRY